MTVEHLTPIERELRFRQWCRDEGIIRFLLDLDDTICPTGLVYEEVMSQAYDFLGTYAPIISRERWKEEIVAANNRFYEKFGVSINRFNPIIDELTERYSLSRGVSEEAKRIFQLIGSKPLTMIKGAEEGLDFIKRMDLLIGIVTHANQEWTWKKYHWLNLERYVDWDDIFIIDENKHKTAESWLEATRYFRTEPRACAVVGDSPRTDINPAWEIGVRHCFLVEDPKLWSVHHQPVDPGVKRISNLTQILDVVLEDVYQGLV